MEFKVNKFMPFFTQIKNKILDRYTCNKNYCINNKHGFYLTFFSIAGEN